jgi:PKD repeat protein
LDNHPKAWYRYQQDTLDFLNVSFHDLSYYEPENWSWNFGDGSPNSTERHPSHHFDSAGVYQVCLTESNLNSSSTHCKVLYLGVSGLDEPKIKDRNLLFIQPNPVSKQALISLENPAQNPMDIKIYGINGHLVWTGIMPAGSSTLTLEMGNFPAGIYLCYAMNEVGAFAPVKFVVQH